MRELDIGRTVLGRAITALAFQPPSYVRPRPAAVLVAAIHGDEPLGVYCLTQLITELIERPPGRHAFIVPALNVDGLAAGTKNNANDIDIDRNFAALDWTAAHRPGYKPGPEPASEPETRALCALIENAGATRVVSLGSPYRMVHWCGQGRELATCMAEHNGYPVTAELGYAIPGSLRSRYGVDRGLEVVTLEIPFMSETSAWQENRAALRHVLDLPV